MSLPPNIDDDGRAEMLCYLVFAELVAMARTDEWLRTDHMVESSRIWMKANGATCAWEDRIMLASAAVRLAPEVMASFELAAEKSLAPLFTDGWMLDYRSPVVCDVHQICASFLKAK